MLASCPKHGWSPKRGPGGSGAAGLCPGCVVEIDLKSGRVHVVDEQIREGRPRSKDPEQRRHIELGLVSDGPPTSSRWGETPLMAELWSAHLARQANARREEEQGLMRIEQNRRRRERLENPRKQRVRSQSYQDGAWVIDVQPGRRDSIAFEIEDWD